MNSNPMPMTYSVNFNIPNANPYIPISAQTPIPMTTIPMPISGYPLYTPYQPDIIKNYDVKISTGDLGNIKHIYEDMVPKNNSIYDRYASINERLNIANYYNSIIGKYYDISVEETINKVNNKNISNLNLSNLLGHIKINNINPYHYSNITDIPLRTLPYNFVLFTTCFPIQFKNFNIKCSEDSLRSNLRIYKISDLNDKQIIDVRNELIYYNKVTNLVKKYNIPNFVMLYGTFTSLCNIDFNTLNIISENNNDPQSKKLLDSTLYNLKKKDKIHQCLLMLTESVNYNLIAWTSKKYEEDKDKFYISKVTSTGLRSTEVWKSIIFQLLVVMYILDKNKIGFRDFSFQNNIFIKKIDITTPNNKYWKYKLNNMEYYVPNQGFIIMLDSNFIDPQYNNFIESRNKLFLDKEYNIYLKKHMFNSIFNYDKNFGLSFIKNNGIPLDKNIEDIFKKIQSKKDKINNDDFYIDIIIELYYKEYGYNKLGQLVLVSETSDLVLFPYDTTFNKGDLVLYHKYSNYYIISYYDEPNDSGHNIKTNIDSLDIYDENKIELKDCKVTSDIIIKFQPKDIIDKQVIETYEIN
jgi:hypothetical protein